MNVFPADCDLAMLADPDGDPITVNWRRDGTVGRVDPVLAPEP